MTWQPGDPIYRQVDSWDDDGTVNPSIDAGWHRELFELIEDHKPDCRICNHVGLGGAMRWTAKPPVNDWPELPEWRDLPDREGAPTP